MNTATVLNPSAPANPVNLYELSQQWASRPDDQRFLDLTSLRESVYRRAMHARTEVVKDGLMLPVPTDDASGLLLQTPEHEKVAMTNWSFGQLAMVAGAPAGYLRKLPSRLVAANLIWGLRSRPADASGQMLYVDTDGARPLPELRALTSESYGRIYDLDVVDAVIRLNEEHGGRWVVPAASYTTGDPKRATTLYASDRDVYLFLCDPTTPVQIPGQQSPSYRGFIVSNSEVGAGVFRLALFLYERVCDNRIIWGASDFKELRIRHNAGAPERFIREAAPQLLDYAHQQEGKELERIARAQKIRLTSAKAAFTDDQDAILKWVQKQTGLPRSMVAGARQRALEEEGKFDTVWDAVQGITALARGVAHTDARVGIETAASKLLN